MYDNATVTCVNCGGQTYPDEMIYDNNADVYTCDMTCFYDWCADNLERVSDYYYEMNCV